MKVNKWFDQNDVQKLIKYFPEIKKITVACDAGMGSSALMVSKLKASFKEKGIDITLENSPYDSIAKDSDLVIIHKGIEDVAREYLEDFFWVSIDNFTTQNISKQLIEYSDIKREEANGTMDILKKTSVLLGLKSMSKEEAILLAGEVLYNEGYVTESYPKYMLEREKQITTFVGKGTAIPHGTNEAKKNILATGISVLQFPDGVDFDGNPVYLIVGIAGKGNEHLSLLASLVSIIEDDEKMAIIRSTDDVDYVYRQFTECKW